MLYSNRRHTPIWCSVHWAFLHPHINLVTLILLYIWFPLHRVRHPLIYLQVWDHWNHESASPSRATIIASIFASSLILLNRKYLSNFCIHPKPPSLSKMGMWSYLCFVSHIYFPHSLQSPLDPLWSTGSYFSSKTSTKAGSWGRWSIISNDIDHPRAFLEAFPG